MPMTIAAQISDDLANLSETHGASVLRVEASGCRGGSGIAWSKDLVVTAAHLIEGDVSFALGDGSLDGKLVGRDLSTDIAVFRVDGKLTPAPFSGLEKSKVGHLTLSLARPGKTVRAALGMIGTLGEGFRTRGGGRIDHWLQPDGGVPSGFSGSVLLDAHGRALGMNTHGLVRGAGLTIPTSTLRRVIDELVAHGHIRRGYLGVGVSPVRFAGRSAVVVVAIEPNGPADKAGLLVGDVVLSIEGETIEGPRDLAGFLADKIAAPLKVSLTRGGQPLDVTVTTRARP